MWIILFSALDDFGIREVNEARSGNVPSMLSNSSQIETAKRKLVDEALHGALRIAGLVRVRKYPRKLNVTLPYIFRQAS